MKHRGRKVRLRLALSHADALALRGMLGQLAVESGDDGARLAVVERVEGALFAAMRWVSSPAP